MSNQEEIVSIVDELSSLLDAPPGPDNSFDMTGIARAIGVRIVTPQSSPQESPYSYERMAINHADIRDVTSHDLAADVSVNLAPRLKSSGGRPTVPEWNVGRLTGFASSTWEQLQEVANLASTENHKISPAQIASYLVEKALAEYGQ